MAFFRFVRGKVPLGNSNLANAKVMGGLSPYDLIGWHQWRVLDPLRELPYPSQLFVNQSWNTAGLGGLIAGGIVFQGLQANPNQGQS